jgi:transcriptional regulator with XRE-family HTH domain
MSPEPPVPGSVAIRLGLNLQRLRAASGQTQVDVAQRAGIARAHYSALEGGTSSNGGAANPRLSTLLNLAAALGTTLTDLLEGLAAVHLDTTN